MEQRSGPAGPLAPGQAWSDTRGSKPVRYGRRSWIWKLGLQISSWFAVFVLWLLTQNFLYLVLDWVIIFAWFFYVKLTYGWDQGLYALMDSDPEGPLPELPAATAARIAKSPTQPEAKRQS
ncbi:MAG: hypothetical protein L3K07_03265 [Thermoplasmata archaeon]|nr:hypothetical protein [Thermoplasmata archaeon]